MAKIKVLNKHRFDIGIRLINPVREQNIKGGSFTIIDEEDVYYLDSISTLFKRGYLVVEDNSVAENIGTIEIKESVKSQSEFVEILKSNFNKMKSDLSKINEPHIKDTIYNAANSIIDELSGAKIKFLNDYCGKDLIVDDDK